MKITKKNLVEGNYLTTERGTIKVHLSIYGKPVNFSISKKCLKAWKNKNYRITMGWMNGCEIV